MPRALSVRPVGPGGGMPLSTFGVPITHAPQGTEIQAVYQETSRRRRLAYFVAPLQINRVASLVQPLRIHAQTCTTALRNRCADPSRVLFDHRQKSWRRQSATWAQPRAIP